MSTYQRLSGDLMSTYQRLFDEFGRSEYGVARRRADALLRANPELETRLDDLVTETRRALQAEETARRRYDEAREAFNAARRGPAMPPGVGVGGGSN